MVAIPMFTLNNGSKMPAVGMGCWMGEVGAGERCEAMCRNAIQAGYRHFDTATGYGNEARVGRALRESGVPRAELYVTTKLPNSAHHKVREAFEKSLEELGLGYIDLYLMHWPQAVVAKTAGDARLDKPLAPHESPTFVETWKEMEKLLETGKVKSIGVSNFSIKTLTELLPHCSVVPVVNQVELHPCLPQVELKTFCEGHDILLVAYSPLGQTKPVFLTEPAIVEVAERHRATPAQVALSWGVQRGTPVIPKSENEGRMKANITLLELTPQDMAAIDVVHKKPGMHTSLGNHHTPGGAVGWAYEQMGWDMEEGGKVKGST